ncbi:MAG: GAF domain-containing protein [Deltaproteobacteria bacterium]|nr:GAF domain-containing protein [Deltaproteobacteria bacterium]
MVVKPAYQELEERVRALENELAQLKAVESSIRQERDALARIFREISIPTFVIDSNHRVTHVNKAFEKLTGISAHKVIGTGNHWQSFYETERPTMADLILDNAPEKKIADYYEGNYQKSPVTEGGFQAERLFRIHGKEPTWLFFTASPLKDEKGNIRGAIETLQDITAQKKAEQALRQSEKRLRILLDFVPYPIVVFNLEGRVYYLNPAFTETFGWTLEELEGKTIPYTPPGLERATGEMIKVLLEKKIILRHETRRLTKAGKVLDVVMRAGIYSEDRDEPAGELVLLRDITQEKKIARNNEALLRISTALPAYTDLEELLDYVSGEIRQLLNAEGGLVILLDEERDELYFMGAAYGDSATQKRIKEIRFPADKSVAGKVVRTGRPLIVHDTSKEPCFYPGVDRQLGYHTRNMVDVPLRSADRIIGVLSARNKKDGDFDASDLEILSMIAGPIALSVENARFSEEIIRAYSNNAALLRISTALPRYPDLEELQDYVTSEVKRLMGSEGAIVILLDEEKKELFFIGASYEDAATEKRVKEIRFPIDALVAGRVIRSGKPLIISDTSADPVLHRERDRKLGYHTRNLLLVPLKSRDRIIGTLCAINKKEGSFDRANVELLSMVAGTVALSIENARYAEELKKAYLEVSSMNRAKDKVINHLSHELKTPVSVLSGSLKILEKSLRRLPEEGWKTTLSRGWRNLGRIVEIQNQVEDIMRDREYRTHRFLSHLLEECVDELETLFAEEMGEGLVVETVRNKIDRTFGPREMPHERIALHEYVRERIARLKPLFSHRQVDIITRLDPVPEITIPTEALQKTVDGLLKNAVENTPNEGKVEISVRQRGDGTELRVDDYGVGIIEEAQKRIFEGFFATQDTMSYSSKRAFDFNAGGKGADLLRMKIFSERYNFRIEMESSRCRFIPEETDLCPGRISKCRFCAQVEDCYHSGGSSFTIHFPPASTR